MSTVKTKINQGDVVAFLKQNFDESIDRIEFLKGGEASQAFAFESNDEHFVIRINTNDTNFKKDAHAAEFFATPYIPIPKIFEIGKFDNTYFYAISRQAEGVTVNNFSESEYQKVLPKMLDVLDAIHAIDIRDTSGYGSWDVDGVGEFDTWRDFLLAVGMYIEPNNMFETTFLEKDVWTTVFTEIEKLAQYCPEERYLIHADYGSDNVVSNGENVTGVLDWAQSKYGDFLYDVAWLSFWAVKNDPEHNAEKFYRSMEIQNFEERILCYKLRIGLSSLSFYAYSGQKDKYDLVKARTLALLK